MERNKNITMLDLNHLRDEGFILFRADKFDIENYVESELQYKVITGNGYLKSFTCLHSVCGKTINDLDKLETKGRPNPAELEFFKKWDLKLSWFNLNCYREIGMILLTKKEFERREKKRCSK